MRPSARVCISGYMNMKSKDHFWARGADTLSRNNIASARLAGIEGDLNLSSVDFETAVSILFVGYVESLGPDTREMYSLN
jgi:hypothetical protein